MSALFLLEKGQVIIEDGAGGFVSFSSPPEFYKYSDNIIDLTGKEYIDYRPGDEVHYEGNVFSDPFVAVPEYDSVVAAYEIIRQRKDDPYYGATLDEAKTLKIGSIKSWAAGKKRESFTSGTNILSSDGLQSLEDLQTQATLAAVAGDLSWTIDVILENEHPDGTNKRLTMGAAALIGAIRNIWERNEGYNQTAQDAIDIVSRMTTVEAVKNFYKEHLP